LETLKHLFARIAFLPTYAWNILLGRVLRKRRWWDAVDEQVILGARPMPNDVSTLRDLGVRAVVNMCEEFPGPVAAYEQADIEQLWLPTIDFQPPTLTDVSKGVDFIQSNVESGKSVYVHCKAGRARSATVVLCWLVKHRRMTPEQAQAHLLERRPHVNRHLLQREVVQQYVQGLRT
jgi:atypical dual specificity phosphatase